MIPFLNFEEDFLTTEDLLFLAGASGANGVEDTATGNPVTFLTDLAKPLKSLVANFLPIQSGTGDPSPTNIRPITGWTGLDVMHGADQTDYDTYPVTWTTHGTIYGGYVDLVTGEVWKTQEQVIAVGSQSESWGKNTVNNRFSINPNSLGGSPAKKSGSLRANYLKNSTGGEWVGWIGSTGNILLFPSNDIDTMEEFKEYLSEHNLQIVYELAEPVLIATLSPQQINALKGNNTVWSDANGDCEVTYLKKG